jgi:hypothetical protein
MRDLITKRFKFYVTAAEFENTDTVHVVIMDIMLVLAWYHSVESVLAGDGSHSTDQPAGRG